MTAAEMSVFKDIRDNMSFYRTAICVVCGVEIIKGKQFCSLNCMEKKHGEEENQR